jgi:hypothetical protein
MLKRYIYKLLIITSVLYLPANGAATAKVRLAAGFAAKAIRTTASAAKAHPFLTLAATATTAAAVAAQREHSRYRRAVYAIEKRNSKATEDHDTYFNRRMAELKKDIDPRQKPLEEAFKKCQSEYDIITKKIADRDGPHLGDLLEQQRQLGSRKQELGDQLTYLANQATQETLKILTDAKNHVAAQEANAQSVVRAKVRAARADHMSFREFARQRGTRLSDAAAVSAGLSLYFLGAMSLGGVITQYVIVRQFKLMQSMGLPCVINFKHIKTLEEAIQCGMEERRICFKIGAGMAGAIPIVVAGTVVIDWLQARRRAAEQG